MDVSRCDGGQEAVERESSGLFHIVWMPHRVAPVPPRPDLDDRVPIQQASDQPVPVSPSQSLFGLLFDFRFTTIHGRGK